MNGPRTKGDIELEWLAIKRAIQAKVNYRAQVWRERELNRELDTAWKEFKAKIDNSILPVADPPGELLDAIETNILDRQDGLPR